MQRFSSYQPSGFDWLGEIPAHWTTRRAKYVFQEIDDRSISGNEELLSVSHLTGVTPRSEKNVTMFMAEDYTGAKLCRDGDLVINTMWAWMGALGVSSTSGIVSPAYGVYRQRNNQLLPRYADWLFRTPAYIAEYTRRSMGVNSSRSRLYPDRFLDLPVVIPSMDDQKNIVTFLDKKTAELDSAISKKERLIELLLEQKEILINHAVTKGLSSSIPMQVSDIPWVGAIPRHWQMIQLKRVVKTKITDGPHETPKFFDEGVPFVSVEGASDGRIDLQRRRGFISAKEHSRYCKKLKPQRDDIFFVKSGSTTGKTVIVDFDDEFSVWSPLALIRPKIDFFIPTFLLASLQSTYFQRQVQTGWSQGTQPNIGMADLEKLWVIMPPVNEQRKILEIFEPRFEKINEIVCLVRQEVNELQQWKDTLIAESVTGRIKV